MGATAELAAAILTQCELRERAVKKFGDLAHHMLFTRDGYEQATRQIVAQRHAARFADAGANHVADLGCGNAADSLALLQAGLNVYAVDIDPDAQACAEWNLRMCAAALSETLSASSPLGTHTVTLADVTTLDITALQRMDVDAIFADPARRTGNAKGSARVMTPEQWAPPLHTVLSWQRHVPFVGVKVAPGIAHEYLPADFTAEWVSVDGDLVEAALWSARLCPEGSGRQAVVIQGSHVHVLRANHAFPANAPVEFAPAGPLGDIIAEPDPAVIRAGLVSQLAAEWGAHALSEGMAYLSADDVPTSPFAQRFEVLDVVALKPKHIVSVLRGFQAHSVEVKKRGADLDPAALRQSVRKALVPKGAGSEELTVIATRIAGKHQAVIARRLT